MNHLIILHCQIVACLLQVGNLHEVAAGESFADVWIVILGVEVCAGQLNAYSCSYTNL